ncbi:hypothetical protein HHL26_06690 [Sphingobium sp. TB-6]|uniref:head-tail connector protein n=1 Tax=Sphingobium sp. TB-6 TaxID=2728850 RepID=UPI00146EC225|nr:head-tail connector protein [Sphingobium sp. TB-6]NML88753.1 hypothetical protein [Sphingobium sp. TB-6]
MAEPLDLDEVKLHLRVVRDAEDALIGGLITAAREWVENFTGQLLVPLEITQRFDAFCNLALHAWPIAADAVIAVTYVDSAGETQNIGDARLVVGNASADVAPAMGSVWPTTYGPVGVTVTAGYSDAAAVPQSLKQAMLLLIGSWYNNRESVSERPLTEVPMAVEMLCMPYRLRLIG